MSKVVILTGRKFGRLTVLERDYSLKRTSWLCSCECGNYKIVRSHDLVGGRVKSCGCIRSETTRKQGFRNATHNMTGTRLWRIWSGMKQRCKKDKNYTHVSVCEEWEKFECFYSWAISNGYKDGLSLDRIDCNGDYCPENCRWATWKQQENNRRNNRLFTYKGETKTVAQWSDLTGIRAATISWRINAGWEEKDIFMKPDLNNARIRRQNNA